MHPDRTWCPGPLEELAQGRPTSVDSCGLRVLRCRPLFVLSDVLQCPQPSMPSYRGDVRERGRYWLAVCSHDLEWKGPSFSPRCRQPIISTRPFIQPNTVTPNQPDHERPSRRLSSSRSQCRMARTVRHSWSASRSFCLSGSSSICTRSSSGRC